MNSVLEWMAREMNPSRDFENAKVRYVGTFSLDSLSQLCEKNGGQILLHMPKHVGRGMSIGIALGTCTSIVADYDLGNAMLHGSSLGAIFDTMQYYMRFVYKAHQK